MHFYSCGLLQCLCALISLVLMFLGQNAATINSVHPVMNKIFATLPTIFKGSATIFKWPEATNNGQPVTSGENAIFLEVMDNLVPDKGTLSFLSPYRGLYVLNFCRGSWFFVFCKLLEKSVLLYICKLPQWDWMVDRLITSIIFLLDP